MSTKTLRKRISLVAVTALTAGVLSVVAVPSASAAAGDTNLATTSGVASTGLYVATQASTTGAGIVSSATDVASAHATPRSLGLLSHDGTTGTAQTATVLNTGKISLYAGSATNVSFTTSGGSFSGAVDGNRATPEYNQTIRTVYMAMAAATPVAVLWNAPSTAGTYTISYYQASATLQNTSTTGVGGNLMGAITVTVVAASAGGAYSAAFSACNTRSASQGHGIATGVDTTSAITNAQTAYIVFDADDAYDASLDSGAIVVSATGGALISLANNGSTAAAGTTSTVVQSAAPTNKVVQVTQATANAPLTTTVTVTYNGTTICTKTVTIRGEISKLEIGAIGVGDINSANDAIAAGADSWITYNIGDTARAGLFTVVGRDSAGNAVVTNSGGIFSADSATLTTTVQALSVPNTATSVSSSTAAFGIYGIGTWTCGATAGSSSVKLKWTNTGSGTVVTSDAFNASCADDPYTYTASFDKASYVQGELATLTVQFLDSKGNKANTVGAHGALTDSTPMFTEITAQTATIANKAGGFRTYVYSVGTSTGLTAGSYVASINYASLVAGTTQTPTYKVSTGADTTTNADVLKSIVALIASINKQIQALQKLILKK